MDVVVIGAGQAGLSASHHLRRRAIGHVVLDHAPAPGGAWQFRWPTLTWERVHGMHPLPGTRVPEADPGRPSAEVIGAYFGAYERDEGLPVLRPAHVRSVTEDGTPGAAGRLLVDSDAGRFSTRALVNATGTWDRPFRPSYPGADSFRGRQPHTADYRGPEEFAGLRVVVVGGGTSAVQHLLEIAPLAASVRWVTRRPPVFHEEGFGPEQGRAAVALVEERVRRGLPPQSVVTVTGLQLTRAVRDGLANGVLERRPMFERIGPAGPIWADGHAEEVDVILWATGFRPAMEHLAPLRLREPGGGIRMAGTRAARDERVHLVGYGPSASTIGANRAGGAVARELAAFLARPAVAVPA
ncbi:NAD(P)-binding domain-containing protein [Streptomyces sp. BI20]|uniref:NAD(P)-binding domain-containing protein n=1 Tax=Streptomyces sp. BI20 TaxID=3403460 RepID=UPI003C76DEAC